MTLFPMFLKLEGRSCLVVGAGAIAETKIRSLLVADARVRVVAPAANVAVSEWARARLITREAREFTPADLANTFLVIAATSSRDLNQTVFHEAQSRNILCNAVDDPDHCDFYYPAVVRRGELQIAISTAGRSPALAQRLRHELEAQFGPEYALWLEGLGSAREELFKREMDPEERRRLLHDLASRQSFVAAHTTGIRSIREKSDER
jgi:precorrin-2 dehydrogenase / sirohydrochlorin ferrochelatase